MGGNPSKSSSTMKPENKKSYDFSTTLGFDFEVSYEMDFEKMEKMKNYGLFPLSVLHRIFLFLQPCDLLNQMVLCKLFFEMTKSNHFWKSFTYQLRKKNKWELDDNPNESSSNDTMNWKIQFFENFSKKTEEYFQKRFFDEKRNLGNDDQKRIKIYVVGNNLVGKTSFIDRIALERYVENSNSGDVGYAFRPKTFFDVLCDSESQKEMKMQLWNSVGSERYCSIRQIHEREAKGIAFCFALNNIDSFDNIESFIKEVPKNRKIEEEGVFPVGVLLGLKSDLDEERVVTSEEAKELVKKYPEILMDYVEVSSKTGKNVVLGMGILLAEIQKRRMFIQRTHHSKKMEEEK